MSETQILWIALSMVSICLVVVASYATMIGNDVRELKKRIRTMDDGVWFSNKLSNLEWRLEQVETVKHRETLSLDDYRRMRRR